MIYNRPNQNQISKLNGTISDLQGQVTSLQSQLSTAQADAARWEQAYNDKTFDFSGANITTDNLPLGLKGWDANGVLIAGTYAAEGEYGSDRISGTLDKGSYVKFDGIDWIIASISGNTYTLMKKKIEETAQFNSDYSNTSYKGSAIASKCTTFQNNMSANALSVVNSKTVQSVTAKVWIATKSNIELWTDSSNPTTNAWNGVRMWTANADTEYSKSINNYWCSDPRDSSYVWFIDYGGYFYSINPGTALGFRPCIEVTQ